MSGIKVTMLVFLIKGCVAALEKYAEINSSPDGDALIYKHYFHSGFAADAGHSRGWHDWRSGAGHRDGSGCGGYRQDHPPAPVQPNVTPICFTNFPNFA